MTTSMRITPLFRRGQQYAICACGGGKHLVPLTRQGIYHLMRFGRRVVDDQDSATT